MTKIKKHWHLDIGKDALDLFKSLIDVLRYEYDYDESSEPMGTLVNIYKDAEDCYKERAYGNWSTKKSTPKPTTSFEDNVNKMRINNYARAGNLNTVMKKRDV